MNEKTAITTLSDVLAFLDRTGMTGTRHRDMVSAIKRVCAMAGSSPACVPAEAPRLRETLSRIRPAAHGITAKSYSNIRSLLAAALELAGIIDLGAAAESRGRRPASVERPRHLRQLVCRTGHRT
jgi:hypothetical protein